MHCIKCGNKLAEDSRFCGKCGTELNSLGEVKSKAATIKCGNCDYIGPGELARSKVVMVLAWLCVLFAPLITIIYFVATNKYRCPKCKSTFLGIQGKDGNFSANKGGSRSPVFYVLMVLVGIAIIGILASVVLASLNTARERGKAAQEKALGISKTELTYEVMQEVAKDYDNKLPQMLDSDTRWDSTEGIENGLIYKYTLVNYDRSDFEGVSLSKELKPGMVNSICSSPDLKVYIRNGATLEYRYYDRSGLFIQDIVVNTKTDC
jgi:DNA-directed RNA polymerase subunit RPC12/RpoP